MIRRYTNSPIEHLGREAPRGQLLFKATELQEFLGYSDDWAEFTDLIQVTMRGIARHGHGEIIPLAEEARDGGIAIGDYHLDITAALLVSMIGDPRGREGVAHMQRYIAETNCRRDERRGS